MISKKYLNHLLGVIVVLIGTTTFLGWITHNRHLAAWNNSTVTMKPWSAFSMTLAGLSCIFNSIADRRRDIKKRLASNSIKGFSSAIICCLALMQTLFVCDAIYLKIIGLNVFRQTGMDLTWKLFQQIPSQITIGCIFLYSLCMYFNILKRTVGIILLFVGLSVLLGYITGKHEMYFEIPGLTTAVALNTATCFCLLGFSLEINHDNCRN